MKWINRIFNLLKHDRAPSPSEHVKECLSNGKCPDCGGGDFYMGPKGGLGQNIQCVGCKQEFCVAPFEDGQWIGPVLVAQRI